MKLQGKTEQMDMFNEVNYVAMINIESHCAIGSTTAPASFPSPMSISAAADLSTHPGVT